MQLPLFPLKSNWVAPDMSSLPEWQGGRIGLDTETRDPYLKQLGPSVRRGGYIVGVSFAFEDGPSFYLPIRHEGGDNLDEKQVLRYLRDQAKNYKGTIVGANLNYDLDYLAHRGIVFPNLAGQLDVQIADPLIYELYNRYDLDTIGLRWGFEGKNTDLMNRAFRDYDLKPSRSNLWKLPARYVGEYADQDAVLPLQLIRKQEQRIDELGLRQVYNLESKLQPVLLAMRRHGVRIDQDKLDHIDQWSKAEEEKHLKEIHRLTGITITDVWKKGPLVPLLEHMGIKVQYTPTDQPQIDQDTLDVDHPVAKHLARARKVNHLRTTFVSSIRQHLVGDRIHTTFNQLRHTRESGEVVGARYGRMSSENPNLQNQPSRDEFAKMWRSIYVPDHEGQIWFSADYSQQEPRILTHFAELIHLPGAKEAAEQYRKDPNTDNHQMMADMCGIPRKPAKDIYLGLCYGMGGGKLAVELGLPTKIIIGYNGQKTIVAGHKAQSLLNTFKRRVPFVPLLAETCENRARNRGCIITLLGRRCNFPTKKDGTFDWCYKAINRLIQGSAGDQTKAAMVAVYEEGLPLQLQVHDELDGSADTLKEAKMVAEVMEHCAPLNVPSKVDLEVGDSWGEAA